MSAVPRRIAPLRFRPSDQRFFARLSGDFNPIHLDSVYARRTIAGQPIVHGINLLLHALETHFPDPRSASHVTVSARFLAPAFLGEPIVVERAGDPAKLVMLADLPVAEATIELRAGAARRARGGSRPSKDHAQTRQPHGGPPEPSTETRTPAARMMADIEGARGAIAVGPLGDTTKLFPRTSRALGAQVVKSIVRLSRLVGMECPGRDSLLSALQLDIRRHSRPRVLEWHVGSVDRRFGLIRVAVRADGVSGTIDAFLRPSPASPLQLASVAARVDGGEFAGQRALVVGGSRGLGAATAAVIACGGGVPLFTYATGVQEAAALERDLAAAGHSARALPFDVTGDCAAIAEAAAEFGVTHVYYFATPKVYARRREPFDKRLYDRFSTFYVDAFARLCDALRQVLPRLTIFYPSSTAIDEGVRELTEYAAAKAAGEALCGLLEASLPGLDIVCRRLPRISTDQTRSLIAAAALDPLEAVLPIVREMHPRSS